MIVMSRPKPPPDCDWKLTRASAISCNLGAISRSQSTLDCSCPFFSVRYMVAFVGSISEKAESTMLDWLRTSATCRSEEHTSELQSLMRITYAVFCLTKKKKQSNTTPSQTHSLTTYDIQL